MGGDFSIEKKVLLKECGFPERFVTAYYLDSESYFNKITDEFGKYIYLNYIDMKEIKEKKTFRNFIEEMSSPFLELVLNNINVLDDCIKNKIREKIYIKERDGCLCQSCGRIYKIDLIIPYEIWKKIIPKDYENGLLCGICIMEKIEELNIFGSLEIKDKNGVEIS